MKRLKLFIESYKRILISGVYALAVTFATALLLSWSRVLAYMSIFIIVTELTYSILVILTYEDEKNDGDI